MELSERILFVDQNLYEYHIDITSEMYHWYSSTGGTALLEL